MTYAITIIIIYLYPKSILNGPNKIIVLGLILVIFVQV